jgi:hypothetical protein
MIFKAMESMGSFEIETLNFGKVKYSIRPFDADIMEIIQSLPKDLDSIAMLEKQMEAFCPEFERKHLEGVPINTLAEMVTYITEMAEGTRRTEAEKKTESKKPIKS